MINLLIKNGPRHRRHGQPRLPRRRTRRRRHSDHPARRRLRDRGGQGDRRRRPGHLPRLRRHTLPRRPHDPRRAAPRPEGAAGGHNGARGYRRHIPRAIQVPGRTAPLHLARFGAQRLSSDAGRLAHRGGAARQVRQHRGHQRGLHPRQLSRADMVGGLERQAGHRRRDSRDALAGARGHGGGRVGPVHGPGLSPRCLRRYRRARRALRGVGPHGRLLPHPHPRPAQGQGPAGPVGGGPGDRTSQRYPGTPDPLPADRAGCAQPP